MRSLWASFLIAVVLSVPAALRAQPSQGQGIQTITVQLSSFAFTPDQLRLRAGTQVRLQLRNVSSGGHNFTAPAFFAASTIIAGTPPRDGKVEVPADGSVDITLVPRTPGTYHARCTHFLHSLFGMTAMIVVQP